MHRSALVMLGCGWIARRHATAARRLRMPIIFASRDAGRAAAYAREFGGVGAYGDYGEALRDPRARGAVVCTPHDRHLADALAAFAAGRHVLMEKPIAPTLEEADRMIDAAARAGCVLMTAENFHFMPVFRWVRAALSAGTLGALREIHLVGRGWRRHAGWRLLPEAGGGALIDGGIHYVHLLNDWAGPVRRVFALRPPQTITEMAGEDAVDVLAECHAGVIGFLANSLGAPGVPRFQWSTVTGTRATCFADNRGRVALVRGEGRVRARLFVRDTRGHETMLKAFDHAMTTGRAAEMDGAAGRRDLAVVVAAYRSITERVPVTPEC
jgi:UDP-N-acetyl-2-amino-2-deoxyglucuronate dehydrogenase